MCKTFSANSFAYVCAYLNMIIDNWCICMDENGNGTTDRHTEIHRHNILRIRWMSDFVISISLGLGVWWAKNCTELFEYRRTMAKNCGQL